MKRIGAEEFAVQFAESEKRVAALKKLPKNAHIHLVGISGSGMAAVLQLLKEIGFRVTGSDQAFYPPMGEVVRRTADTVFESYSAENLRTKPAFLIIGNSVGKDNSEVVFAEQENIPYASMPEVLSAFLVREPSEVSPAIVICGTHGKTTATAAAAALFDSAGRKPGFFIGGMPLNFSSSVRRTSQSKEAGMRTVILEGDEDDSAFFARWPKFLSYRPDLLLLTTLEFDHADIYESLSQIEAEYTRLLERMPNTGGLLVCDQGEALQAAYARWKNAGLPLRFFRYGYSPDSDFRIIERTVMYGRQRLKLLLRNRELSVNTCVAGSHNALNLLGAAALGDLCGLSLEEIRRGIEGFGGVKRRLQEIAEINHILLIEDFAHHPTAVRMTLESAKESFPNRRIVAVFEPRSNSTRGSVFQQAYAESFGAADLAVILEVAPPERSAAVQSEPARLDVPKLVKQLEAAGTLSHSFPDVSQIEQFLLKELKPDDAVILMSSGDFGGLIRSLPDRLNEQFKSMNGKQSRLEPVE